MVYARMRRRRRFSDSVKENVVRTILEGESPTEVAKKYHVSHSSIYKWLNVMKHGVVKKIDSLQTELPLEETKPAVEPETTAHTTAKATTELKGRFIIVCQTHGWIGTTLHEEFAEDIRVSHRLGYHPDVNGCRWDGEIIVSKEIRR